MHNPFEVIDQRLQLIEKAVANLSISMNSKMKMPVERPVDKLLDKHQVAEILGCSTSTVDNLARRGDLPRIRIASSVRFKHTDVMKLIDLRTMKNCL